MYYEKEEDCPACNAQLTNYDGQYCGKCGASYWNKWTPTTMSAKKQPIEGSLVDRAIETAVRNLRALNCQFIVIRPDGETHTNGDLVLAGKEPPKKRRDFTVTGYMERLENLTVGETILLDAGEFSVDRKNLEAFRSTVAARCTQLYGTNTCITAVARGNKGVEVLRLG